MLVNKPVAGYQLFVAVLKLEKHAINQPGTETSNHVELLY